MYIYIYLLYLECTRHLGKNTHTLKPKYCANSDIGFRQFSSLLVLCLSEICKWDELLVVVMQRQRRQKSIALNWSGHK